MDHAPRHVGTGKNFNVWTSPWVRLLPPVPANRPTALIAPIIAQTINMSSFGSRFRVLEHCTCIKQVPAIYIEKT